MSLKQLMAPWKKTEDYRNVLSRLQPGTGHLVVGLNDLPRALWTAALWEDLQTAVLLIVPSAEQARIAFQDLSVLLPAGRVLNFPAMELLPVENYARNMELEIQRLSVLRQLAEKLPVVVIATVQALNRKVVPPGVMEKYAISLSVGGRIDLHQLPADLTGMGYQKENLVEIPGTFSLRGGIIDIFPFTGTDPVRIELFDDEIESIRAFDPANQRSLREISQLKIFPAREVPLSGDSFPAARQRLSDEVEKMIANLSGMPRRHFRDLFSPYLEQMGEKMWNGGMEQFLLHFYPQASSLLAYFDPNSLVVISEPDRVSREMEKITEENQSLYLDLLEEGKILPSFADNFVSQPVLLAELNSRSHLLLAQLPDAGQFSAAGYRCFIVTREMPAYKGNFTRLGEDIKRRLHEGYRVYFSASSPVRAAKMQELVSELETESVEVIQAGFSSGFESDLPRILLLSEKEILGQSLHAKPRRPFKKEGKIDTFLDLKVDDYVVHVNHGIGRYRGVERLQIGDTQRDYLLIQYAGADRLYVPTDQVDMIQKYIGSEDHGPKLNKLGGAEWGRAKSKARSAVQDMAKELLTLYAYREAHLGHAFSPDTVWQQEFEDAFPYTETPDQLRAVDEIKKDMENPRVMDRLLCGDVGYGKTEVAMRAAFKAVMDGKQVGVLVPTTVLAEQHQRTFQERFAGFPVKIGVLSRFKSNKIIAHTLTGLGQGTVDIVIGTHRLLSTDVKFHDLGLLIVDEEQRFGVAHKERIKGLKQNIDVLAMSATPIPRTLHMSLVGVRDMSVIETPPEDRQPVQTYVMEYQERVIKEAISREISRGGQVYFVHNRVNNIDRLASQLNELVPEAKVLVAHGQMKEQELENVMLDFVEGSGNVLVCTTIIESGLDIPSVNTMIVNEADRFGLSQLYQLRGRVGRSDQQAYAYFTYRKDKILTEIAKKRLTAIRDFTELGSGFKIAMRDMELRGAGNILGPEQHGHILAVGFDLYCRLVEEEVQKQRFGPAAVSERISPQLELKLDAFIPDAYVPDNELKIEIYKRLAGADGLPAIKELEIEVEDRYGVAPRPVDNLFRLGRVKVMAEKLRIAGIAQGGGMVTVRFISGNQIPGSTLSEVVREFGRRISFGVAGDLEIKIRLAAETPEEILLMVFKLLALLMRLTH